MRKLTHMLSGLDIIGPQSIYASEARRRQTSASEAEHDESFTRSHDDDSFTRRDGLRRLLHAEPR